jgi:addiction module HigA family antidote
MLIRTMKTHKMSAIHPGEILLEEFLKPLNLSQYRLAKDTGVPSRRINEIVHGKRAVSALQARSRITGTRPIILLMKNRATLCENRA